MLCLLFILCLLYIRPSILIQFCLYSFNHINYNIIEIIDIIQRMHRIELVYFIILACIVLFSQFISSNLLLLLDNFIIRIIIVLLLLHLISIGPTAGIFGLFAIAVLYLERNRRKLSIAYKKLDLIDVNKSQEATVEEASTPQSTVPVNNFDAPTDIQYDYMQLDSCENDTFEPISYTINEKEVLSSVYPLNSTSGSATALSELFYK